MLRDPEGCAHLLSSSFMKSLASCDTSLSALILKSGSCVKMAFHTCSAQDAPLYMDSQDKDHCQQQSMV